MERLITWSLQNRPIVLVFTIFWIIAGIDSLVRLPVDAVPDVTNVQVVINTEAPGLSPPEVESLVTIPIEALLLGLPHLEEVRSLSKYGLSQITVVFDEGTDLYFARQLVAERLNSMEDDLPETVGTPTVGPIATGLSEIYQYELHGDERWDQTSLRTLQDWFVTRQLLGVDGVTEVNSFGGLEKEYQVVVSPTALQSYGLGFEDLFTTLEQNNRNVGGGYLESRGDQLLVRGLAIAEDEESLGTLVVAKHQGSPILVRDLATVEVGGALRQGAVTRDGRGEVVTGIVMMLAGENSRAVARRVDERVEKLKHELPDGVQLETFYDRTELVDRTLLTVRNNLLGGAALVIIILFLFLGDFRAALVVASVIPLSFLGAAFLMVRSGVSGNLMSLGALDFGLVVDGAVVMAEHSVAALALTSGGGALRERIRQSCTEVARPIFFGLLIIIAVYFPLLSLSGMEGKMFRPMALTVMYALISSLLLSFTLVPVLLSFVLKPGESNSEPTVVRWLLVPYRPLLRKALEHPLAIIGLAVLPALLTLIVASRLGAVFLPDLDEGDLAIQAIRVPSVSLPNSLATATIIEKALHEFPEVESVISKTGRPDLATDPMGVEISDIIVIISSEARLTLTQKEVLVERMRERLERIPGIDFSFSQPIELRVEELLSGTRADVALNIYGDDLEELTRLGEQVVESLGRLPGIRDLSLEQANGVPYLNLAIDRDATARYGIRASEILDLIEISLGRKHVSTVVEGERSVPVVVKLPDSYVSSPEVLATLPVRISGRVYVPLSSLVKMEMSEGVAQINRFNGQRRVVVSMNYDGGDLIGFVDQARRLVDETVPSGFVTEWGGEYQNFQRASGHLVLMVPLVLGGIFFLLWLNFHHLVPVLVIYLNVPFAAVGGVLALALRGLPFSISAGVGFLTLFGVAVLNGLVLMSEVQRESERGGSWLETVENAALSRLRPVMMTASVASLGFLPMALSTGAGAEVQRPLATVVIGGLITSTMLTLFVLPAVLGWLEKWVASGSEETSGSTA